MFNVYISIDPFEKSEIISLEKFASTPTYPICGHRSSTDLRSKKPRWQMPQLGPQGQIGTVQREIERQSVLCHTLLPWNLVWLDNSQKITPICCTEGHFILLNIHCLCAYGVKDTDHCCSGLIPQSQANPSVIVTMPSWTVIQSFLLYSH